MLFSAPADIVNIISHKDIAVNMFCVILTRDLSKKAFKSVDLKAFCKNMNDAIVALFKRG